MTYYRILQYLKKNGLDDGKAHYVRNMILELVNESVQEDRMCFPEPDGHSSMFEGDPQC